LADNTGSMQIRVEKAPKGAEPFTPGEGGRQVKFKLQPLPPSAEEMRPYVPRTGRWKRAPYVAPENKPLVLDIETTGLMPWDSRLMLIGVKDMSDPESTTQVFYDADEERTLRMFIDYFNEGGFNEIVAYNLPFDMRYIYAKGMRYRMPMKAVTDARWTDLAWRMQQVKRHSSAMRQKAGRLEDWISYLLGEHKTMNYKELLAAWGAGDIEQIKNYNVNDVERTAELWQLSEYILRSY